MANYIKVFLIAVSLAMDALSVSIASGTKSSRIKLVDALKVGATFGLFQAGMPVIGWLIGETFRDKVDSYTGLIAFVLLSVIGLKMIYDAVKEEDEEVTSSISFKLLIGMGIATSIDALIVGTTLVLIKVPLFISVLIIGIVTFILSILGYSFGVKLGTTFGKRIEIVGGLLLIFIGITFLF